jgi:predicted TIM-barrel fold metal-dependent hydrolase
MICDVDTRLWSSRDELGPTLGGLLRRQMADRLTALDASEEAHAAGTRPVDRAFVLGFRAERLSTRLPNDSIAAVVRNRPDRLVGFAGIDPLARSWREDLDRAVDLGLSGVTVSPSFQGCPPTHSQAMRLWERCVERQLPVVVSRPTPLPQEAILEYDRPTHWDEALRSFPTLRIVFASFGAPYVEETLLLLTKFPHTFTHCAASLRRPIDAYRWISAAADLGVLDRILFASGFPFDTPTAVMERLYGLNTLVHGTTLPSVPRRELQAIVERDALALLGIRDRASIMRDGEQRALLAAAESLRSET